MTAELLYLSRADVVGLLPPTTAQLDLVERTYRAMALGGVELPPKPGIHPRPDAFIHAMPAYLKAEDVAMLKWVSGFPGNPERGLPYIHGLIVVNDPDTGAPLAVMDAAEITAARTAAASGVCVRRWAREGWRRAAILGCGEQGRHHARMLRAIAPDVELVAYDPRPGRAATLAPGASPAGTPREAVDGADVVVTAAPIVKEPEAPIAADWIADGVLVLPIDFDALVQVGVIEAADLFLTDDVAQFEAYRGHGHFRGWPAPQASVGEALEQGRTGRRVACCNLGVGALDATFAKVVLDRALEAAAGTRLPL
jgi:ornithine cyclodeaminase/alanine dehydrogenase